MATRASSFNSNTPARNQPVKNANLKTTVVNNGTPATFDCENLNAYRLVVVTDPDRASQNSGTAPGILNIVAGDEVEVAIKLPTDSDAQNFSLDSAEKTKEGFNITIEYGSRYYYKKQFYFICKEGDFYLREARETAYSEGFVKACRS